MTRKLEDILNLPNVNEAFAKVDAKEKSRDDKDRAIPKNVDPQTAKALEKTYQEFDKIAAALPQVK